MKRAILIGASSGIGRALAKVLVREGYVVGIAARRVPLLLELQQEVGGSQWQRPRQAAPDSVNSREML